MRDGRFLPVPPRRDSASQLSRRVRAASPVQKRGPARTLRESWFALSRLAGTGRNRPSRMVGFELATSANRRGFAERIGRGTSMDSKLAAYIASLPPNGGSRMLAPIAGTAAPSGSFWQQVRAAGLVWRSGTLLGVHALETVFLF